MGYLAMVTLIVWGLFNYRSGAIETYGTDRASAQWQDWRQAAEKLGNEGPVARRVPKSGEPPALVLMRDHFSACLGISILLSSCLFGWMMICVRGVLRPVQLNVEDRDEVA